MVNKLDSVWQNFCLFCLEEVCNTDVSENLATFLRAWHRFAGKEFVGKDNPAFGSCHNCAVISNAFCGGFEDYELLLMGLEFNLARLVNIIAIAEETQEKMEKVNAAAGIIIQEDNNGGTLLNQLKIWRQMFTDTIKKKLTHTTPRVLLKQVVEVSNSLPDLSGKQDLSLESPEIFIRVIHEDTNIVEEPKRVQYECTNGNASSDDLSSESSHDEQDFMDDLHEPVGSAIITSVDSLPDAESVVFSLPAELAENLTDDSKFETDSQSFSPVEISSVTELCPTEETGSNLCTEHESENADNQLDGNMEPIPNLSPHEAEPIAPSVKSDVIEESEKTKVKPQRRRVRKKKPKVVKFGDYHKKHPCSQCTEKFFTVEQRDIHLTYHGTFHCQFCDTVKHYAPDLSLHELESHGTGQSVTNRPNRIHKIQCPSCPYSCVLSRDYIRHHLEKHLGLQNAKVKCSICQASFMEPAQMRKHKRRVHNIEGWEESQIHRCDECTAYFNRPEVLVIHKSRVHLKSNKCQFCTKLLANVRNLKKHMKLVHPEKNTDSISKFQCDVGNCKERFYSQINLDKHRDRCKIHQEDINGYQCEKCGKNYNTRPKLARHRTMAHPKTGKICSVCGKTFTSVSTYYAHKEYHKKPEEWRFPCGECGRRFADRQKLDQHGRTHTKEKPFVCQFCGVKYAHRHNWRIHVKAKHPSDELESGS